MTPLIIFHGNCPDGYGAAWWLGRHLGQHEKFAARYDEPPPLEKCSGREVFIVDFCYPPLDLAAIEHVADTVDVFDHHETAAAWAEDYVNEFGQTDEFDVFQNADSYCDVAELSGGNKVNLVIDQSHSGVGIVAGVVKRRFGVEPLPFLLNLEDRDLWKFELPDTKAVFAAVTSYPYDDDVWDELARRYHGDLVNEGRAISRYRDQLVDQVAASHFTMTLGGMNIPTASSPYAIGSDVAGRLAEQGDGIGAYVILHADHVQVGLRSRNDGPNVADIASNDGGGGHPHASGLRLTWEQFEAAT